MRLIFKSKPYSTHDLRNVNKKKDYRLLNKI